MIKDVTTNLREKVVELYENKDFYLNRSTTLMGYFVADRQFHLRLVSLILVLIAGMMFNTTVTENQSSQAYQSLQIKSDYEKMQETIEMVKQKDSAFQEDMGKLSQRLATEQDINSQYDRLNQLGSQYHLDIINLQKMTGNAQEKEIAQAFDIEVQGKYHNILQYINEIERGPIFASLDSVTITHLRDKAMVQARINYKLYYQR